MGNAWPASSLPESLLHRADATRGLPGGHHHHERNTVTPPAFRPLSVAVLRGMLYALFVGVVSVIVAATPADLAFFGTYAMPLAFAARVLEAALLDRKQPPQLGPLGGKGPA